MVPAAGDDEDCAAHRRGDPEQLPAPVPPRVGLLEARHQATDDDEHGNERLDDGGGRRAGEDDGGAVHELGEEDAEHAGEEEVAGRAEGEAAGLAAREGDARVEHALELHRALGGEGEREKEKGEANLADEEEEGERDRVLLAVHHLAHDNVVQREQGVRADQTQVREEGRRGRARHRERERKGVCRA